MKTRKFIKKMQRVDQYSFQSHHIKNHKKKRQNTHSYYYRRTHVIHQQQKKKTNFHHQHTIIASHKNYVTISNHQNACISKLKKRNCQ